MEKREKRRRGFFVAAFLLTAVAIFAFNFFTPFWSDDYSYASQVRKASNYLELFAQEYNQYMTWTGRSVAHMLLRTFLYLPTGIFKVMNSLCFLTLSLVLYDFVDHKKRYDVMTLVLVQMCLWFFTVDFDQTVLWETGACNYLWGTTIILGFMDLMRHTYRKDKKTNPAALIGFFLFGVVAGWCNENTSGACLLFSLLLLIRKGHHGKTFSPRLLAGAIGNAVGLAFMVLAPGNAYRASFSSENYSGLAGKIARFQKVSLNIRNEYFFVLVALIVVLCIAAVQLYSTGMGGRKVCFALRWPLFFTALFFITCYALIATTETQPRAYFGAGMFPFIAIVQCVRMMTLFEGAEKGRGVIVRAGAYAVCLTLCLHWYFVILDNGTNLFRIWRDASERAQYLEEAAAEGKTEVTVARVHEAFYNDYSCAEDMDPVEDPGNWLNVSIEEYYGIESISAIEYDDWEALVGEDE